MGRAWLLAGALSLVPWLLEASPAAACGGLFCNSAQPVNQAAERIVFVDDGEGGVSAIIEVQYEGPASEFAWVLPVPGVPEVGVSSSALLDGLQQATNPIYQLQTTREECASAGGSGGSTAFRGSVDGGASSEDDEHSVDVLAAGTVGPYDYTVLSVEGSPDDPAQVALDWLADNGYDVGDLGPELLRDYLDDDLNLLAFRLTKDATSGSIRPIWIDYEADQPFIPIRPTAVAANDDMGILVWVVSGARAVPRNYKDLQLNEALIDWFNPMSRYDAVVTAAADEAQGQGFVTELSQATSAMPAFVDDYPVERWQEQTADLPMDDDALLVETARGNFAAWDGFSDAVADAVTLPDGVDLTDYIGCPRCYVDDPDHRLDRELLLESLQTKVIDPVVDAEALIRSRPQITRLYTTMSADEMTVDPLFDDNPDLPDVSNVHVAERLIACDGRRWQILLPQGDVVHGSEPGVWPVAQIDLPAARKIAQLSTSGDGEVVEDNSGMIRQALAQTGPQPDDPDDPKLPGFEEPSSCGCRVPGGQRPAGAGWAAALLLACAASRWRRPWSALRSRR